MNYRLYKFSAIILTALLYTNENYAKDELSRALDQLQDGYPSFNLSAPTPHSCPAPDALHKKIFITGASVKLFHDDLKMLAQVRETVSLNGKLTDTQDAFYRSYQAKSGLAISPYDPSSLSTLKAHGLQVNEESHQLDFKNFDLSSLKEDSVQRAFIDIIPEAKDHVSELANPKRTKAMGTLLYVFSPNAWDDRPEFRPKTVGFRKEEFENQIEKELQTLETARKEMQDSSKTGRSLWDLIKDHTVFTYKEGPTNTQKQTLTAQDKAGNILLKLSRTYGIPKETLQKEIKKLVADIKKSHKNIDQTQKTLLIKGVTTAVVGGVALGLGGPAALAALKGAMTTAPALTSAGLISVGVHAVGVPLLLKNTTAKEGANITPLLQSKEEIYLAPQTEKELIKAAGDAIMHFKETGKLNLDLGSFFLHTEVLDSKKPIKENLDEIYEADIQTLKDYVGENPKGYKSLEDLRAYAFDFHIHNYDPEKSLMSNFYEEKEPGGNCEARTKMMVSYLQRSALSLSENEIIGLKTYKNHIEPVIYNKKTKEVTDLIGGNKSKEIDAPIYHPILLLEAYLNAKGKSAHQSRDLFLIAEKNTDDSKKINSTPKDVKTNTNLKHKSSWTSGVSEGSIEKGQSQFVPLFSKRTKPPNRTYDEELGPPTKECLEYIKALEEFLKKIDRMNTKWIKDKIMDMYKNATVSNQQNQAALKIYTELEKEDDSLRRMGRRGACYDTTLRNYQFRLESKIYIGAFSFDNKFYPPYVQNNKEIEILFNKLASLSEEEFKAFLDLHSRNIPRFGYDYLKNHLIDNVNYEHEKNKETKTKKIEDSDKNDTLDNSKKGTILEKKEKIPETSESIVRTETTSEKLEEKEKISSLVLFFKKTETLSDERKVRLLYFTSGDLSSHTKRPYVYNDDLINYLKNNPDEVGKYFNKFFNSHIGYHFESMVKSSTNNPSTLRRDYDYERLYNLNQIWGNFSQNQYIIVHGRFSLTLNALPFPIEFKPFFDILSEYQKKHPDENPYFHYEIINAKNYTPEILANPDDSPFTKTPQRSRQKSGSH